MAELAYAEPKEDISVAVGHESGWYLTVLPDGNVLLDNSEIDGADPESAMLHQDDLIEAFRAVARGDIAAVSLLIDRAQESD